MTDQSQPSARLGPAARPHAALITAAVEGHAAIAATIAEHARRLAQDHAARRAVAAASRPATRPAGGDG